MLMHATARGGGTDTVRVCTGGRLEENNPLLHGGLELTSVSQLAFQSDAVPTELSPPQSNSSFNSYFVLSVYMFVVLVSCEDFF